MHGRRCAAPPQTGDSTIGSESVIQAGTRQTRHEQAARAARIADEYRSRDVVVLDLTAITPIVDYFVVATGTSRRQIHAVADEISRVFKADGDERLGIEGYDNHSGWVLLDFGDIVIHCQDAETRALYDLVGLWADAPHLEWQRDSDTRDAEPDAGPATGSATGSPEDPA